MEKRWVRVSELRKMVENADRIFLQYSYSTKSSGDVRTYTAYRNLSRAQARKLLTEHSGASRSEEVWVGLEYGDTLKDLIFGV